MIDWLAFVAVAISTLVGAVIVVGSYSSGVRLLAVSGDAAGGRRIWLRIASNVCFAICFAAVLLGIYLIIPPQHFANLFG